MIEIDLNSFEESGFGAGKDAEHPYTGVFQYSDAEYWQGFFWTMGTGAQTKTVRVSKALRIRYKIGTIEHYLVVGYEGAGGI
jgi:hypothetical protein